MTQAKTQTRGHCPLCGRVQAVRYTMAKHGYTVSNGWFQGVCGGHNHQPLEISRVTTDKMVADVRADCDALDVKAAETLAGKHDPVEYRTTRSQWVNGKRVPVMADFASASEYQQTHVRESLAYALTMRARAGRQFADDMQTLADRVHGQPLTIVTK